jgi:hypothetical protein
MTTASAHQFFAASASVAGALIGLLFVAISVNHENIIGEDASEVHGVRAAATLSAFTNALTVALFALVPGINVGVVAEAVAIVGLLFVLSSLIRVTPAWRDQRLRFRELAFFVGLVAAFVVQLIAGIGLEAHAHDSSDLQTICIVVVACLVFGIFRAWELVGGPKIRLSHQIVARIQRERAAAGPDDTEH